MLSIIFILILCKAEFPKLFDHRLPFANMCFSRTPILCRMNHYKQAFNRKFWWRNNQNLRL